MNLIPPKYGTTPNYFCTWDAQHTYNKNVGNTDPLAHVGDQGASYARESLNENSLFGKNGIALQHKEIRGDLFLVLDDGWDVPYGLNPSIQRHEFGSLLLNEDRFPSFAGNPAERLRKINEKVKELGWRGIGLWVASQARGEHDDKKLPLEEAEVYWRERVIWSREAGIPYWKVDWGVYATDPAFREMLTKIGKELYPELLIEHCVCMNPYNKGKGRISTWEPQASLCKEIFYFSDVFRSYDVINPFGPMVTMDRVAHLLTSTVADDALGLINCEDQVYLGAALGCTLGIMRASMDRENPSNKMNEPIRAVKWQRIAPAFGAEKAKTYVSDEIVYDSWFFEHGETWAAEVHSKEVKQGSPLAVSRGISLPIATGFKEKAPFMAAARNPTGAVSIVTLPRIFAERRVETPLCNILLEECPADCPIGIFGYYGQLTLGFDKTVNGKKIYAQDLACDTAVDITKDVTVDDTRLTICGSLIRKISGSLADDKSEPGIVILLV
ncbi:MAG: hypothetical protein FWC32_12705 [Firmicutes bacterium]|nr:hypothetical protein [Bacillota bacterium]